MKNLQNYLSTALLCIAGIANSQAVITLAGTTTAGSANGTGSAAGLNWPIGVAADGSGNLYVADYNNNEIRKIVISSGVVTTFAGTTTGGSADGTGTGAGFSAPVGIGADNSGNLYVADYANNKIRKIVISSGVVTTIAGSGAVGAADGAGTAATFNHPTGVVADDKGNLFVADEFNNEIRQIIISSGMVSTLAGTTTSGIANGTGTSAKFYKPLGIATDHNGNLFVSEIGNSDVRMIVISSAAVTTVASTGFNQAWGVAADTLGNLYVADAAYNEIQKVVVSSGAVSILAGSATSGHADGTGTSASFFAPCGITMDKNGALYVGDRNNNEVRMITGVLGINQLTVSTEVYMYPNPVSQILYLKFLQPIEGETALKIMDITGKQLSIQHVSKSQNILPVDVSSLPAGLYFISMEGNNGMKLTGKFVKQ